METLAKHERTHNDIKPQNFLVKFGNDQNDLSQIQIVLTDFGLAGSDSKGGTPIFSSPECLASKERKNNPDIFSLGRVMLFTMMSKEFFLEFLFLPIMDSNKQIKIKNQIEKCHILKLVSQMMKISNRIDVHNVRDQLQNIKRLNVKSVFQNISTLIRQSMTGEMRQYIREIKRMS